MDDPTNPHPPDQSEGAGADHALPESLRQGLARLYAPAEPIGVPPEMDRRIMQMARRRLGAQMATTPGRARGISWGKSARRTPRRRVFPMRLVALSAAAAAILIVATIAPRLTPTPSVRPGSGAISLLGDVDSDGRVDIIDALLVAKLAAGERPAAATRVGRAAADMNADGTVDAADALAIRQLVVRLEGGAG